MIMMMMDSDKVTAVSQTLLGKLGMCGVWRDGLVPMRWIDAIKKR